MKTLFVTSSSFERFDGGVSIRYQETRDLALLWNPIRLVDPPLPIPYASLSNAVFPPDHNPPLAGKFTFMGG